MYPVPPPPKRKQPPPLPPPPTTVSIVTLNSHGLRNHERARHQAAISASLASREESQPSSPSQAEPCPRSSRLQWTTKEVPDSRSAAWPPLKQDPGCSGWVQDKHTSGQIQGQVHSTEWTMGLQVHDEPPHFWQPTRPGHTILPLDFPRVQEEWFFATTIIPHLRDPSAVGHCRGGLKTPITLKCHHVPGSSQGT